MRCLYCGKPLPLLKKLTGGGEFCSDAHRNKYQEEYNKLALSRLLQAQTPNAAAPGNLSPRALRQLPPPAPRAGAPRALPPPSAPPTAESKKGGLAGIFSSRKPAAIEAPAPSAGTVAATPAAQPAPDAPAPASKSSIWKTFVRTERPAPPPPPPPPPEPDPVEASFLLARVDVRKPLGNTLMARVAIEPVFLEDVPRPAGASAVVSLIDPVAFDWDEAFLLYCCDSDLEAATGEPAVVLAAEVEPVAPADDLAGASEVEMGSASAEILESTAPAYAAATAEFPAEVPPGETLVEAESALQEESVIAGPPASEEEAGFTEPPIAAPIVSSPVTPANPQPLVVMGLEPELPFEGLVLYPTCAEVDLGSPRPSPVREKILEPLSFGGAVLPAAHTRSLIPRRDSRRPPQSSNGWHPGTPLGSWRPSLQFVPPPQAVAPAATAAPTTTQAPPPPRVAPSEQHHEVVINLAALGILGEE